jgi:hypothetical protein
MEAPTPDAKPRSTAAAAAELHEVPPQNDRSRHSHPRRSGHEHAILGDADYVMPLYLEVESRDERITERRPERLT